MQQPRYLQTSQLAAQAIRVEVPWLMRPKVDKEASWDSHTYWRATTLDHSLDTYYFCILFSIHVLYQLLNLLLL